MNDRDADFLSVDDRSMILADARAFTSDPELSYPATYKSFQPSAGAGGFDPTTGTYGPGTGSGYVDHVLTVHRGTLSNAELLAKSALYERGDVRFAIERSALPARPAREDRIIVGNQTYELIDWATDPLNALWTITARLVRTDGAVVFDEATAATEALS